MENVIWCREVKGLRHFPPVRIIPSDASSVSVFTVINEPPDVFLNETPGSAQTTGLGGMSGAINGMCL